MSSDLQPAPLPPGARATHSWFAARRPAPVVATFALAAAVLMLVACASVPVPVLVPAATQAGVPSTPCSACSPATQVAELTQANIDASARQAHESATADIENAQALATYKAGTATQGAALVEAQINTIALQAQAAATADILRAHALATVNAARSTQGAAQTQDSLNSSAIQSDMAGTAAVLQAVALATFNSASSTQSSAQTQVALVQTQAQLDQLLNAQLATQSAAATGTQQWMSALVAGTATTLAGTSNLQTQSAGAIAQGVADQSQQQNQASTVLLLKWGVAIGVLAAALWGLLGFGRWLTLHTTRQPAVEQTVAGSVHGVVVTDGNAPGTPPATATHSALPRDPALQWAATTPPGASTVEPAAPPRAKLRRNQE